MRDKIPEIIQDDDGIPKTRIIGGQELQEALLAKLSEESTKLLEAVRSSDSNQDVVKELSDVLAVLRAIAVARKIEWDLVEATRQKRQAIRGGFSDGVFLEKVENSEYHA